MKRIVRHGRAAWGWVAGLVMEKLVERLVMALVMVSVSGVGVWWTARSATAHEKTVVQATANRAMTQGVKAGRAMSAPCPHTRRVQ